MRAIGVRFSRQWRGWPGQCAGLRAWFPPWPDWISSTWAPRVN